MLLATIVLTVSKSAYDCRQRASSGKKEKSSGLSCFPSHLPVGTCQEEVAERWQGPEGVLERAVGPKPEAAA